MVLFAFGVTPIYNALDMRKMVKLFNLGISDLIDHIWGIIIGTFITTLLILFSEVMNRLILSPSLEGQPETTQLIIKAIYEIFKFISDAITTIWDILGKIDIALMILTGIPIVFRIILTNTHSNRRNP